MPNSAVITIRNSVLCSGDLYADAPQETGRGVAQEARNCKMEDEKDKSLGLFSRALF